MVVAMQLQKNYTVRTCDTSTLQVLIIMYCNKLLQIAMTTHSYPSSMDQGDATSAQDFLDQTISSPSAFQALYGKQCCTGDLMLHVSHFKGSKNATLERTRRYRPGIYRILES